MCSCVLGRIESKNSWDSPIQPERALQHWLTGIGEPTRTAAATTTPQARWCMHNMNMICRFFSLFMYGRRRRAKEPQKARERGNARGQEARRAGNAASRPLWTEPTSEVEARGFRGRTEEVMTLLGVQRTVYLLPLFFTPPQSYLPPSATRLTANSATPSVFCTQVRHVREFSEWRPCVRVAVGPAGGETRTHG